jgi:hypothetical protein
LVAHCVRHGKRRQRKIGAQSNILDQTTVRHRGAIKRIDAVVVLGICHRLENRIEFVNAVVSWYQRVLGKSQRSKTSHGVTIPSGASVGFPA